jgi:hypothetical protein
MDNKDFKKHLAALVHGHHHPEEHDWSDDTGVRKAAGSTRPSKSAVRKSTRRRAK